MFRPVRDEMSKIIFLLPKFCAYGTCFNNPANPLILLITVQTIIDYPVRLRRACRDTPTFDEGEFLKKGRIKPHLNQISYNY
jgi:hypothetical protein